MIECSDQPVNILTNKRFGKVYFDICENTLENREPTPIFPHFLRKFSFPPPPAGPAPPAGSLRYKGDGTGPALPSVPDACPFRRFFRDPAR